MIIIFMHRVREYMEDTTGKEKRVKHQFVYTNVIKLWWKQGRSHSPIVTANLTYAFQHEFSDLDRLYWRNEFAERKAGQCTCRRICTCRHNAINESGAIAWQGVKHALNETSILF